MTECFILLCSFKCLVLQLKPFAHAFFQLSFVAAVVQSFQLQLEYFKYNAFCLIGVHMATWIVNLFVSAGKA